MTTGQQRTLLLIGMHDGVCQVACGPDGASVKASEITKLDHAAARLAVCARRPRVAYLAAYEAGLWRSEDGGGSWRRLVEYPVEHAHSVVVHPDDADLIYAGSEPAAIFRSSDGGATWSECESFRMQPEAKDWHFYEPRLPHVRALTMAADDPARLYAGIEVGGVYRSDDAGATWRSLPGPHADVHTLSVTAASPQTVFAGTAGGPYRSDDGGETWEEIAEGLPFPYIVPITPAPDDPDLVLLSCATSSRRETSRLMRSTDGGRMWRDANWPGPESDMAVGIVWDPVDVNVVYAGTDAGRLYRSEDRGANWRALAVEVGSVAVGSLAVSSG